MSDAPAVRNDSSAAFAELVLLPWESEEEFVALHRGLLDEHAPTGPTEARLVEQLAVLFWRRQRVMAADRALHLATLNEGVSGRAAERLARRALICTFGSVNEDTVRDAIRRDRAADAAKLATVEVDQRKTQRALKILGQARDGAYERALAALDVSTREWWLDELASVEDEEQEDEGDEGWKPTAASLERFLETEVDQWYWRARLELADGPAIRRQAFAESLDPQRASTLQAYDARLDRQIERTLGLLFRLQEMRAARLTSHGGTRTLPHPRVGSNVGTSPAEAE